MLRGRTYRLDVGSSTPDLKALSERFGLHEVGSLLLIPLASAETKYGAFLFLSPYSDRLWTAEDQNYFAAAVEPLAHLLQQYFGKGCPGSEPVSEPSASVNPELDTLLPQVEQARQDNQHLKEELDRLRQQPSHPDVESLLAVQKEAQETIALLQIENEHLRQASQPGSDGAQAHRPK